MIPQMIYTFTKTAPVTTKKMEMLLIRRYYGSKR